MTSPWYAVYSNRRPDEEGIKTVVALRPFAAGRHSNRRPDEEGIKTLPECDRSDRMYIPTADLMKKGLRLNVRRRSCGAIFQPQT